jgi:hypothetical protein
MSGRTGTFAGTWQGFYSYGGPSNIYEFTLQIELGRGDSIAGTILEQNHEAPLEISGFVNFPVVRFFKLAVNKKSVRFFEPIEFQGFLSSDSLHVSGSWTNASAQGDWSAQKSEIPPKASRSDEERSVFEADANLPAGVSAPVNGEKVNTGGNALSSQASGEDLVPIDAPVESWDPEETDRPLKGGLAGALKGKLQDHNQSNVHSFFTIDPLEGEPDLGKQAASVSKDRTFADSTDAVPDEEKSASSGSFIAGSEANQSAFAVNPLEKEPEVNGAIAQFQNRDTTYGGAAPPANDPEKPLDAGSFIAGSEANKSPFMVNPLAAEFDAAKAPSSASPAYASSTGDDTKEYWMDTKDIAGSTTPLNTDSNRSAFMIDPIGNLCDLLPNSSGEPQATPASASALEAGTTSAPDLNLKGATASFSEMKEEAQSAIAGASPTQVFADVAQTQIAQPQGVPQQIEPLPGASLPSSTLKPSAAPLASFDDMSSPFLNALPGLQSASKPLESGGSVSASQVGHCPRCGAVRGTFSFCMSCGHSFDLSG